MCFMIIIRKHIVLFLMLLTIVPLYGQNLPPFTSLDSDTLTWKDSQGIHLLLLEQSDVVTDEENGFSSQTIQATHWLKKDKGLQKTWSFQDGIKDCPVDIEAKFLAAPQFSDLDNDGLFEIWFIIQKSCKGDVSPSLIEVVMVNHKNAKYFLEAEQKLVFPNGSTDGGTYDLGDFESLPEPFQDYALEYLFKNYEYKY